MWLIIIVSVLALVLIGFTVSYIIGKKTFEDEFPV